MANFYGTGRSNYFKVKDKAAFLAWTEQFSGMTVETKGDYFVIFGGEESGDLPSETLDEKEVNFEKELSKHLADDSIFVFMSAGAEKLRHVSGYALAVNSKGKLIVFGLQDIYDKVKKRWPNAECTRASY